jgi:hypothetical protein
LFLAIASAARFARADEPAEKAEARERFKAGLGHVQQGDLAAAIADFESAYRVSPNFAVLYNLGQAYAAVGRAADAVRTLERFLTEGGDQVAPERRSFVRASIERERAKLCRLEIEVAPPEAEVFLDGRRLKDNASGTLELDPGEHLVVAELDGYQPQLSHVELASGESSRVSLNLERAPHDLALPAVVAKQPPPLPATVPPNDALPAPDDRGVKSARNWALGLGAGGLALAGTAVGLFVWNTSRYHSWQTDRDRYNAMLANGSSGPSMVAENNALTDRAVNIQRADSAAVGLAVAAGAVLTSAAIVWFTSGHAKAKQGVPVAAGASAR